MNETVDIAMVLPHRYPFLMVDRVVEVTPGKRAVAVKNITKDNPFSGTAQGDAWPALLVIEAMAQVGALAATPAGEGQTGGDSIPGYLAGLHDVFFKRIPRVGDQVVMTLDFEARLGPMVRFKAVAEIGGETAVEAGLTFTIPQGL